MTMVPIALASKTNPARYKQGGSARLINCYVEQIGKEGKAPWAVYAADGLQGYALMSTAAGGIRAMLNVDGALYVVAGSAARLYRVSTSGTVTDLGAMSGFDTTGPIYMERNRRSTPDIAIVNNGLMFYYQTTLGQVTDVDLLAPTSLAFLDGYFLIGTANNKWQIGAIDDASAWDALDYERADANPDAVVRVAALQRDAVIFGEVSTEFFRHTGAADFPFERVATIDIGCRAPDSVATVDQTLAWVAHDGTVRTMAGYAGQIISTSAVERDISALSAADAAEITATSWTRDGHTFYSITSDYWTWVYDTRTGLWHSRASHLAANWRVNKAVAFGGKIIAGDRTTCSLYAMAPAFADEAGDPLIMDMTLPPVHAYPHELTVHAVHVDVEKGVGTGQGDVEDVDPELILLWSRDGGHTFAFQRSLKIGQQGQRTAGLKTYRLGRTTQDGYVFRLQCSAKVARAIYQMSADVERSA